MSEQGTRLKEGSTAKSLTPVDIFSYLDFRQYLKDHFSWRKSIASGYSYRVFSRHVGVSSRSYLKMVMDGQRNLSAQLCVKVAKACDLEGASATYFNRLVSWNQAKSIDEQALHWNSLISLSERMKKPKQLEIDSFAVIGDWRALVLLEAFRIDGFKFSLQTLVTTLRLGLNSRDAKKLLMRLENAGLVKKNNEHYILTHKTLLIGGSVPNSLVQQYHHQVGLAALRALDEVPFESREFSGTTVAIKTDMLPQLRDEVRSFQRRILALCENINDANEIIQLNIQLFPLTTLSSLSQSSIKIANKKESKQ